MYASLEFRWLRKGDALPDGWVYAANSARCLHHAYGAILIYRAEEPESTEKGKRAGWFESTETSERATFDERTVIPERAEPIERTAPSERIQMMQVCG